MYNILVCDDDKEIVNAIEIYLEKEGYKIYKAYNGKEALDIINKIEIHLVILDIMMPELDGISVAEKIRKDKAIPIIMLSAKSEDYDKINLPSADGGRKELPHGSAHSILLFRLSLSGWKLPPHLLRRLGSSHRQRHRRRVCHAPGTARGTAAPRAEAGRRGGVMLSPQGTILSFFRRGRALPHPEGAGRIAHRPHLPHPPPFFQ